MERSMNPSPTRFILGSSFDQERSSGVLRSLGLSMFFVLKTSLSFVVGEKIRLSAFRKKISWGSTKMTAKKTNYGVIVLEYHFRHYNPFFESKMSFAKEVVIEEDEIRMEKLEELKELVECEPGLYINNDEKILLRFLHYANFDAGKAFEKMKSWYKLKSENSDWFASKVLTERQKLAMSRDVHCLLKDRDQLGRRVYVLKLGNVVIGECEPWENFQVDDLWLELAMDEEETQQNGLVYIFDMKGLGLKYLRYFTPSNCKVSSSKAENIPIRKMEYHVVNSGFLLNSMVTIVFPFLSGSTKENIHFHKSNWPSLHKYVSPNILPEEYGGKLPALDYPKLRNYITERESRLQEILSYGYRD